jgi:hypothetical protein
MQTDPVKLGPDAPSCFDFREDYFECLHHKKEVNKKLASGWCLGYCRQKEIKRSMMKLTDKNIYPKTLQLHTLGISCYSTAFDCT